MTSDELNALIGFSTEITPLKVAEFAVARSEARFRALFESSSEAVIVMSRTHFLDCNETGLGLLGVQNKEDLLKLTPANLAPTKQPCGTPSAVRAAELVERAFQEWSSTMRDCFATVIGLTPRKV